MYALFVGFPLWWVNGLGAFAVPLSAVLMLALLARTRGVRIPRAFLFWLVFLAWTVASASQLDVGKLVGYVVRFGNMAGCAVLFLYVYNARNALDTRKVLAALVCFFAFVVFGGYLGVLYPNGSLTTIAERLLPASIRSNEYAYSLVHPLFAEVQQPYGSPTVFYRPSAPFAYTNSWGCNVALLVPLTFAAIARVGRSPRRRMMVLVVLLGIVPALQSLNRGMLIGLGVAVLYVVIALMLQGRALAFFGLVSGTVAAYVVALLTGFVDKLQERLHYSSTNTGRSIIYRESFDGAVQSPLFGQGAPRQSTTVDVAIGTQGQIWNLMFSYGFVALGLWIMFFLCALVSARHLTEPGDLWIGATLLVSLVSITYYGYDGPQLAVAMTAAAIAMRKAADRDNVAGPPHTLVAPSDSR